MDNKVKLISKLLTNSNYDKVCGFWIDDETHGKTNVYLIIDKSLMNKHTPMSFASVDSIRRKVAKDIKKWLNIEVFVGSVAGDCNKIRD